MWRAPRFHDRLPSSRPGSRRRRRAQGTWQSLDGQTDSGVRGASTRPPTCCRSGGCGSARVANDRLPQLRGRCCTAPACRSCSGSRPPTSSARSLRVFPPYSSSGSSVSARTRPPGPCSIGCAEPCFGQTATSSPARWRWTKASLEQPAPASEGAARLARSWSLEPSKSEERGPVARVWRSSPQPHNRLSRDSSRAMSWKVARCSPMVGQATTGFRPSATTTSRRIREASETLARSCLAFTESSRTSRRGSPGLTTASAPRMSRHTSASSSSGSTDDGHRWLPFRACLGSPAATPLSQSAAGPLRSQSDKHEM